MLFAATFGLVPSVFAQKSFDSFAAPVPTQILTGSKVFLSNAASRPIFGVQNLIGNEFYAGVKSAGRFQIVGTPEEADLVLEIGHTPILRGIPAELSVRIIDPRQTFCCGKYGKALSTGISSQRAARILIVPWSLCWVT
jgi:hypothetical protein